MVESSGNYVLGLDASTSCIGIALFENLGDHGKLKLLTHIAPKIKPVPETKLEELFKKVEIFKNDFLLNYTNIGIKKVIIEEALLSSNNVYTVATLLKFNGMIAKTIYDVLGIVPDFISSYDSRKYGFPELMAVRKFKKDGTALTEKEISKNKPVLFGDYPFVIDKKQIIWEKVSEIQPQIEWLYDKNNKLKKESYDLSDAFVCVLAAMRRENKWK